MELMGTSVYPTRLKSRQKDVPGRHWADVHSTSQGSFHRGTRQSHGGRDDVESISSSCCDPRSEASPSAARQSCAHARAPKHQIDADTITSREVRCRGCVYCLIN